MSIIEDDLMADAKGQSDICLQYMITMTSKGIKIDLETIKFIELL